MGLSTVFMNPAAASMTEDTIQRRLKIYERARGILDHPDLDELKAEVAVRAEGIEGIG